MNHRVPTKLRNAAPTFTMAPRRNNEPPAPLAAGRREERPTDPTLSSSARSRPVPDSGHENPRGYDRTGTRGFLGSGQCIRDNAHKLALLALALALAHWHWLSGTRGRANTKARQLRTYCKLFFFPSTKEETQL
eukprot:scaffold14736_cov114-Isochrysis_galbana.AAC.6